MPKILPPLRATFLCLAALQGLRGCHLPLAASEEGGGGERAPQQQQREQQQRRLGSNKRKLKHSKNDKSKNCSFCSETFSQRRRRRRRRLLILVLGGGCCCLCSLLLEVVYSSRRRRSDTFYRSIHPHGVSFADPFICTLRLAVSLCNFPLERLLIAQMPLQATGEDRGKRSSRVVGGFLA